ncbi:hypothetical protein [Paenibacillus tarimensis]|uniref:hypothetical protein n=1 Tax=Paenibacillus tarimensis TaxID=416012 RepID=UPI001F296FBE|nr:hypothetical protein [Paenibacillus tarimensis]MCF2943487.1 hypothetical protein [Paenibacillus tarimensis]
MTSRTVTASLLLTACLFLLPFFIHPAKAGVMDRIKDIYNAPEKVEELQSKYLETQAALEQQMEKAERAAELYASQQQELLRQNEEYRQRNEVLSEQNAQLADRLAAMEKSQAERASFTRKIAQSVLVFAGMGLLYLLSVRVWRYLVWRRQKQTGGGSIL